MRYAGSPVIMREPEIATVMTDVLVRRVRCQVLVVQNSLTDSIPRSSTDELTDESMHWSMSSSTVKCGIITSQSHRYSRMIVWQDAISEHYDHLQDGNTSYSVRAHTATYVAQLLQAGASSF